MADTLKHIAKDRRVDLALFIYLSFPRTQWEPDINPEGLVFTEPFMLAKSRATHIKKWILKFSRFEDTCFIKNILWGLALWGRVLRCLLRL